ncbi:uncharacterized protein VTP21DRAFT_8073 [Calcarisporiella thermophila]|uniref:uncharacterized protein n=1 Tax=Calcarisporiella thermophila TaxID=911321 RepID=UPI00374321E2
MLQECPRRVTITYSRRHRRLHQQKHNTKSRAAKDGADTTASLDPKISSSGSPTKEHESDHDDTPHNELGPSDTPSSKLSHSYSLLSMQDTSPAKCFDSPPKRRILDHDMVVDIFDPAFEPADDGSDFEMAALEVKEEARAGMKRGLIVRRTGKGTSTRKREMTRGSKKKEIAKSTTRDSGKGNLVKKQGPISPEIKVGTKRHIRSSPSKSPVKSKKNDYEVPSTPKSGDGRRTHQFPRLDPPSPSPATRRGIPLADSIASSSDVLLTKEDERDPTNTIEEEFPSPEYRNAQLRLMMLAASPINSRNYPALTRTSSDPSALLSRTSQHSSNLPNVSSDDNKIWNAIDAALSTIDGEDNDYKNDESDAFLSQSLQNRLSTSQQPRKRFNLISQLSIRENENDDIEEEKRSEEEEEDLRPSQSLEESLSFLHSISARQPSLMSSQESRTMTRDDAVLLQVEKLLADSPTPRLTKKKGKRAPPKRVRSAIEMGGQKGKRKDEDRLSRRHPQVHITYSRNSSLIENEIEGHDEYVANQALMREKLQELLNAKGASQIHSACQEMAQRLADVNCLRLLGGDIASELFETMKEKMRNSMTLIESFAWVVYQLSVRYSTILVANGENVLEAISLLLKMGNTKPVCREILELVRMSGILPPGCVVSPQILGVMTIGNLIRERNISMLQGHMGSLGIMQSMWQILCNAVAGRFDEEYAEDQYVLSECGANLASVCVRVLSSAVLFHSQNRSLLLDEEPGMIDRLLSLLDMCMIRLNQHISPRLDPLAYDICLVATLGLLVNLTYDDSSLCRDIANQGLHTLLKLLLKTMDQQNDHKRADIYKSSSHDSGFAFDDMFLLTVGLLINLMETEAANRDLFDAKWIGRSCACLKECECQDKIKAVELVISVYLKYAQESQQQERFQKEEEAEEDDEGCSASLMSAYLALLLGCLMKHPDMRQVVIEGMPGKSLCNLVSVVRKFISLSQALEREPGRIEVEAKNEGRPSMFESFREILQVLEEVEKEV